VSRIILDFLEAKRPLAVDIVDGRLSPPLHPWKQNLQWFASSHLARHLVAHLSPDMLPRLGSYQSLLTSRSLVASPILCLPPCLLTLSPDMFASAWLLSSPAHLQDCLVSSSICFLPPICSPSPHRVLLHGWLAGGSIHDVWALIECESPVTSPHHAPHAAWLALVFSAIPLFLASSFWFCFWGWEAVNPG